MRSLTGIIAAIMLASCGNSKTEAGQSANANTASGNIYMDISGHYSDTLPCADCRAIYAEIRLRPDSTYDYVERKLGEDGRPQKAHSERGVYTVMQDQVKIQLTPRADSLPQRNLEISGSDLIASWVQASGSYDGKLQRKDRIIGKKGNDYVAHALTPFNRYPVPVYMDLPSAGISIQKPYLDQASEAEKAVVAYFALHYNAGCEGQACALAEALQMSDAQMMDAVRKWMPSLAGGNTAPDRSTQPAMMMLFFIRNNDILQANVNFMDSEKKIAHETFRFKIGESQVEQLPSTAAPAGNAPATPRSKPQGHTRGKQ